MGTIGSFISRKFKERETKKQINSQENTRKKIWLFKRKIESIK